jgi:hypothetical protein
MARYLPETCLWDGDYSSVNTTNKIINKLQIEK